MRLGTSQGWELSGHSSSTGTGSRDACWSGRGTTLEGRRGVVPQGLPLSQVTAGVESGTANLAQVPSPLAAGARGGGGGGSRGLSSLAAVTRRRHPAWPPGNRSSPSTFARRQLGPTPDFSSQICARGRPPAGRSLWVWGSWGWGRGWALQPPVCEDVDQTRGW